MPSPASVKPVPNRRQREHSRSEARSTISSWRSDLIEPGQSDYLACFKPRCPLSSPPPCTHFPEGESPCPIQSLWMGCRAAEPITHAKTPGFGRGSHAATAFSVDRRKCHGNTPPCLLSRCACHASVGPRYPASFRITTSAQALTGDGRDEIC